MKEDPISIDDIPFDKVIGIVHFDDDTDGVLLQNGLVITVTAEEGSILAERFHRFAKAKASSPTSP